MKFEVYKDKAGEFRWRLRAGNKEIIASGEGYTAKHDCLHCIDLIRGLRKNTPFEDQTKV